MSQDEVTSMIRLRMSQQDAHYAGDLVDGAKIMSLFGDVATEILIRNDGDEGLFLAYDDVEFLAPVYAGDFVEARGRLENVGNTSRKISFECYKVITPSKEGIAPSQAEVLEEPQLVARASGTCVVKKHLQRR